MLWSVIPQAQRVDTMSQALSGSCTPSPWIQILRMVNHYLDCCTDGFLFLGPLFFSLFLKNQECIRAMSVILEGKAKSQSGMRTKGGEYKSVHSLTAHKNQQVKEKRFINNTWWFSSVQWLSRVWLFVTPWTTAHQASLSITNSRSPPKPMSIE